MGRGNNLFCPRHHTYIVLLLLSEQFFIIGNNKYMKNMFCALFLCFLLGFLIFLFSFFCPWWIFVFFFLSFFWICNVCTLYLLLYVTDKVLGLPLKSLCDSEFLEMAWIWWMKVNGLYGVRMYASLFLDSLSFL